MKESGSNDIVELLRMRACPPEGEYAESDHGHSDCYLEREAADEIERLRLLINELFNAAADGGVMYQGITQRWWDAKEALRKAVGR